MTKGPAAERPAAKRHDFTVRWDGGLPEPSLRTVEDINGVLASQGCTASGVIYYMYRDLALTGSDRRWLEANGLRYDITVIPPADLCGELVKTKGHYHSGNYGELYGVISGKGFFLLQKKHGKDVYLVKAKRGDFVVVPSNYGHVIVNPGKEVLKISNWISKKCRADYKSVERKKGFCYYYTKFGWKKNENYKKVPKLRFEKPVNKPPKNLNFLK